MLLGFTAANPLILQAPLSKALEGKRSSVLKQKIDYKMYPTKKQ
ncbi:MAG: hypothetical protein ACI8P9_003591 [Parasphingorhabdus sp.]|jgi:hypothetical protein